MVPSSILSYGFFSINIHIVFIHKFNNNVDVNCACSSSGSWENEMAPFLFKDAKRPQMMGSLKGIQPTRGEETTLGGIARWVIILPISYLNDF